MLVGARFYFLDGPYDLAPSTPLLDWPSSHPSPHSFSGCSPRPPEGLRLVLVGLPCCFYAGRRVGASCLRLRADICVLASARLSRRRCHSA